MNLIETAIQRAGGPAKVARLIGTTTQAACFYRDGQRAFPLEHGATLESASGIKRWELWPNDWHRVWPELIGTPGAPAVETAKA